MLLLPRACVLARQAHPPAALCRRLLLSPPLAPRGAMDVETAQAFVAAAKNPLGHCGDILLDGYVEETRRWARGTALFRDIVSGPTFPADRCAERRGRGRCRGRVSRVAVAQLCAYHQTRRTGDDNIAGARHFVQGLPEDFMRIVIRGQGNNAGAAEP